MSTPILGMPLGSPPQGIPIRWGTVTTTTPLTVTLDGDTTPSPPTATLVGGLVAGDYVFCILADKQLVVLGRYGG